MNLALKNIKKLIQNKNEVFFVLIISQIISVTLIFFSFGVFVSYYISKETWNDESELVEIGLDRFQDKEMGEVRSGLEKIIMQLQERLELVYICGRNVDDGRVEMRVEFVDGKPVFPSQSKERTIVTSGRFMSESEFSNGAAVVVGENIGKKGETYMIGEKPFEIIGTSITIFGGYEGKRMEIPYKACPGSIIVKTVVLDFKGLPRQKDYEIIKNGIMELYGEEFYISDFILKDVEKMITQNSVMLYSAVVILVIALDTYLLYGYILAKRKKEITIYTLTGAKRKSIFKIVLLEIMTSSFGTLVIGVLIFKVFLESFVVGLYDNLFDIYTVENYLKLVGGYLLMIFIPAVMITGKYSMENVAKRLKE